MRAGTHSVQSLIPAAEALARVLQAARPTPGESVPLADALGRVLAEPIVSAVALPPFDTSAMDGFAVRVADLGGLPARLVVQTTIHAGDAPPEPLARDRAAGIMTGAPLPAGADAVVPVEWTSREGDAVRIERAPASGQFVRRRGEALGEGDPLLEAGATVTPAAISIAAAVGLPSLRVARQPRVAVVSTGDEVVAPGNAVRPGQIWDANGPGLGAQIQAAGGLRDGPHHVGDAAGAVSDFIAAATDVEVFVFAGGVSMGERDRVRPELERCGVEWRFWGVRQRPGKPFAFGTLNGRPVFGLPGNPVSAAVGVEVYVRPLLDAVLGRPSPAPVRAVLDEALPKPAGLTAYARVRARRGADGRLHLTSAGPQGSHVARTLLDADGLAHLPEDWTDAPAGSEVAFAPWQW